MYLLDTNVLSELMLTHPSAQVIQWLEGCDKGALFTCSVCEAEIRYGIQRLPDGRKRHELQAAQNDLFQHRFKQKVLNYDSAAAMNYAEIRVIREKIGKPTDLADLMIAAIAKAHHLTLVTRNRRDFERVDLAILNPWEA